VNISNGDAVNAEAEEKDLKMGEIFMLRTDDVIIKEFQCSVKKKIKLHGTLYVFGKHLGFFSKVFGNVTKIIEMFADISSIETVGSKKLLVRTNKKQKVLLTRSNLIQCSTPSISLVTWKKQIALLAPYGVQMQLHLNPPQEEMRKSNVYFCKGILLRFQDR
jgi:hypothetical protein